MSTLNLETFRKGQDFAKIVVENINDSVSPWHSVDVCKQILAEKGFTELSEADKWDLTAGGKYMTTRNGSTIIAFTIGKGAATAPIEAFKIVGCHTDSPCLRMAPKSDAPFLGYE